MAWVKYTAARIVTVNSDDENVHVQAAGSGWALYDAAGRKSETDHSYDSSSQEWGTFTKGETLYFYSDNGNVQHARTFEGTFQDSHGNTIYVVSWEDPDYGTYYGLISPGTGTDGATNTLSNSALINEFTAQGRVDGLTTTPHAVPCFMPGTLVATPAGERMVEELVSGDLVLVEESTPVPETWSGRLGRKLRRVLGLRRAVPVKWIGRRTVSTRFGPADHLMPVRFAAGSLGGGGGQPLLPHSELTVTADHAILVDGALCEAGALVNGSTVTRVPLSEYGESYTVYHVETDSHEIILANGAPAETFVDNASRRAFDNYAEFEALYGANPPEMEELPHPRAANARHLPARVKRRLGIGATTDTAKVA